jgi:hypothetical protein
VTGYTYVALDGQTLHGDPDFFITKYNASGVRQWTVQDGVANSIASGRGIAVDSSGNVYVTGVTLKAIDGQTQHGTIDYFLTKYNASGSWQWTVEDGAANGIAGGEGLALDSSGNIYITGTINRSGLDGGSEIGIQDFIITKYNSSGAWQWTVEDGAAGDLAYGTAIAADSSGNVYVTGYTNKAIDGQALHGTQDFFITKYNTSGARQWTIEDGAASDTASGNSINVDSSGNVYVTGYTNQAIDGQALHGTQDFFITKYDPSGAWQWTTQDGAASDTASGNGITVDSSGNAYVTGYTNQAIDGETLHGTSDFFIKQN